MNQLTSECTQLISRKFNRKENGREIRSNGIHRATSCLWFSSHRTSRSTINFALNPGETNRRAGAIIKRNWTSLFPDATRYLNGSSFSLPSLHPLPIETNNKIIFLSSTILSASKMEYRLIFVRNITANSTTRWSSKKDFDLKQKIHRNLLILRDFLE